MKFAKSLRDHMIEEWKKAYINYRALKKIITKAGIELEEGALPVGEGEEAAAAGGDERDLERGIADDEDDGIDSDDQVHQTPRSSPPLPSRWPPSPSSIVPPPLASTSRDGGAPLESGFTHRSDSDKGDSDIPTEYTNGTDRALLSRIQSRASATQPTRDGPVRRDSTGLLRQMTAKRMESLITGVGDVNPKRWRKGYSPALDLKELLPILPPQCRRFFIVLDRELDKVEDFYKEREKDAVKRFEELKSQWSELADHKKEFQAFRQSEMRTPGVFRPIISKVPGSLIIPGSGLVRRKLAQREGTSARPSTDGLPPVTEEETRKPRPSLFIHGRPEEYTAAKSKLKLATFEYYRSLGMLKSYTILNSTGFTKALKKFEKTTRIPCAKAYNVKLNASYFEKSTRLDELIRETEDAFANVFEHGDRKKALERLRALGSKEMHHFTAWRSGLLTGISIPLLLEGLVKSSQASTRLEIPYWAALLQLFGALLLPVLFSMLFYLNLIAWHYARINYVLIFEFDVRTRMDMHQFSEIPSILLFVFSLFFWAAFGNFWPDHIAPSAYPLAFIVVALALLLSPLPYLYPSARWWLLRSFSRMMMGGLVKVEFRDFFLGDEMNSLYYAMYNLGFLVCTYHHGWPANVARVCSTNDTWTSPVLAALPAAWRLGQSIRRYFDSDGLVIHLLNSGKYTAGIAYFYAYFSWRIHGSPEGWHKALWILFGVINSSYTATWDIIMDWSLLRLNSKNWMLRPELGFKEESWIYYPAMVLDILLRFSWVWYLAPGSPSVPVRSFALAVMEVGRRIMWNGFRVESEHIGNVDGYRVTRNIPLPYVMPGTNVDPQHGLEEELEADSSTRKSRFFRFWHELHDGVVKDFSPLSNIATGISLPSIRGLGSPSLGTAGTEYDRRKPLGGKKKLDSSSGGSEDDGEDEDEVEHLGGPVGGVGEAWRRATELNRAEGVMDAAALGELSVGDGDLGEQHLGTSR